MAEKTVGVLGGMGPEATIEMFRQIVKRTMARHDQEHLRVVVVNNPKVPDRTAAILGRGESCLPELARSARMLERAGADFIVIPCVTVHFFHAALQRRTRLPVLHIVDETVKRALSRLRSRSTRPAAVLKGAHARRAASEQPVPAGRRALRHSKLGLIATTGTIHARLFQQRLDAGHTEVVLPSGRSQAKVMKAIHEIKAQGPTSAARRAVLGVAAELINRGAEAVIAGCTEIPLVLGDGDLPVPVIDPVATLAEAAIERAGGKVRRR